MVVAKPRVKAKGTEYSALAMARATATRHQPMERVVERTRQP